MRSRKNLAKLTPDERSQYVRGVTLLKKEKGVKIDTSGRGFNNTYDYYVDVHQQAANRVNADGSYDAHQGPAFLPWHRAFILQFEQELQRVLKDPNFSLPYWDWTADAELSDPTKAVVWSEDFMGGEGDPVNTGPFKTGEWTIYGDPHSKTSLYREFGANSFAPNLPGQSEVDFAMGVTPYDAPSWDTTSKPSFRNQLEGWLAPPGSTQLHNCVHVWIGGAMKPMSSPNDPVFFLHHCNVDRLWALWQAKHPDEAYVPVSEAAYGQNLLDNMSGVDRTPDSQLSISKLGYNYAQKLDFEMYANGITYGAGSRGQHLTQPDGEEFIIEVAFYKEDDGKDEVTFFFRLDHKGSSPGSAKLFDDAPPLPGAVYDGVGSNLDIAVEKVQVQLRNHMKDPDAARSLTLKVTGADPWRGEDGHMVCTLQYLR